MKPRNLLIYLMLFVALVVAPRQIARAAGPQGETSLYLEAVQTLSLYPGGTLTLDVHIDEAIALYGLQVTCQADPTILAGQSAEFGDFFTESIVGANQMDETAGTWLGAMSQKNPAPALDGYGVFATLTFEALTPGTTTIVCEPIAASRDGAELPISAEPLTVTVLDPTGLGGIVVGSVVYQGRTNHAGIEVLATGLLEQAMVTDELGQFELTQLPDGTYDIQADAPLHLPSCTLADVTAEQVASLDPTYLAGGDVDDSDAIKINDATLVGSNFGLSSPEMDPRADINADGQVNVQDLSILGGNFGKEGCQEWLLPSERLIETTAEESAS